MELIQFHPTTLISTGKASRLFLISEAVRGEGGILRNSAGEAFMAGKHELADLAPRDIVTREIIKELDRTGETNVFLDVSSMTRDFFASRFSHDIQRMREPRYTSYKGYDTGKAPRSIISWAASDPILTVRQT